MKLKSILKTLSLDTLRTIHRFWAFNPPRGAKPTDDEETARNTLVSFLYPRLQLRHSFQGTFAKLGKDERDLIFFLAIHGGDLETAEVVERCFARNTAAFDVVARSLSERGFVFREDVELGGEAIEMTGLPEPYLRYVELPSYWEGYLGSFLKGLTAPQLRAIANQGLKLRLSTSKKHLLIWRIRRALTDPRFLREHVAGLPSEQNDILATLLEKRGVSVYRDLLDQSYLRRYDHARADHIRALSVVSGLVFTAVEGENKQNNLLMVPRDLVFTIRSGYHADRRSLRELDTVSMPSAETRKMVLDNSTHLLRDLVILVSSIRAAAPRVLSGGGIGKNDLKKILPDLSSNKTLKYVRFLTLFAIRKFFLLPVNDAWTVSGTFESWIEDAQKAYADLYAAWLDSTEWNEEFPEGDTIHVDPVPSNLLHAAVLRRMVLRNLESIPHNDWIDFDGFADGMISQIEVGIPGRNPADDAPMTRHNILALESVIAESLYWLGIVAVGVASPDRYGDLGSRGDETMDPLTRRGVSAKSKTPNDYAFAFKATALGRQILAGHSGDPVRLFGARGNGNRPRIEMKARQFTVQPSLEILAPPDLALPILYRLTQFCEVVSVDVMSTLSITRRSVREAMDRGLDGEGILAFLDSHSTIPAPETVRHLIQECSSKHGQVDVGRAGGYIHVDDSAALEEIRAHRHVRRQVKKIIGRKLILLTPQADVGRLAKELRKAGFMPRVDSENVQPANDGAFYVRFTAKELYDTLGILKFVVAMEDELGRQLTDGKARPLFERLQPDSSSRLNFQDFAESISKGFLRRYHAARKKQIEAVAGRYKRQLTRLLTAGRTVERPADYRGVNPARRPEDIRRLVQHAVESESRVEIVYTAVKDRRMSDTIEPESINDDKIYAFSDDRNGHAMFSLSRVRRATLV
jgi:hypothetical protein